jgi:hypothetical protein
MHARMMIRSISLYSSCSYRNISQRLIRSPLLPLLPVRSSSSHRISSSMEADQHPKPKTEDIMGHQDQVDVDVDIPVHWQMLESRIVKRKSKPITPLTPHGRSTRRNSAWDAEEV